MNDRTMIPQEILEDAAEWFARLETESASSATRAEFVQWLTRSPVHIEEFLRVAALHHALSSELKADPEWLADVLAEAGAPDENVVRIAAPELVTIPQPHRGSPRGRWLLAAAAVLAAAVGLGTLARVTGLLPVARSGDRFTTAVGEQRRIDLADGSDVLLNTDTELEVRMDRELRRVDLVRGEAIFDIEKDPTRPFRVVGGSATVEAIGTRFIVHRQPERTVVTVVEGRVLVERARATGEKPPVVAEDRSPRSGPAPEAPDGPPGPAKRSVELEAGRQVTVAVDGTVAEPSAADIESATAWTRGRMVFDSDTLAAVVAEFNRYQTEKLVIADPGLSERRISGVFNIDDPDAFLALLADLEEVRVERTADGRRIIRRSLGEPQG